MLTPIPLMIRQSMLGTNDPFPSQNRVINPDTRIDIGARKPPPRYVARRRSSPIHIPLLRLRREISRRSEYGPDHDEPTSHGEVFLSETSVEEKIVDLLTFPKPTGMHIAPIMASLVIPYFTPKV